ncbi:Arc-like DNA binding domain-containing protein [Thiothrix eikelboomii]|uniref:Arc-like DNA binding domain-containing protein n=1 Tax=Thiothrix eikelboomii TaxID=92487 RepID=A0A1T4XF64_9GAMM|nr:Arc family DNA-binding protein [Thiothrix eikelboomii]SKA88234.1 Arc-like DNA binding domain-containing protein [Thiothrix eikelboomii]
MSKESQQVNPYPIRLTKELREKLEAIAKANGRSLNAEMILRLESTLESDSNEADMLERMRQIALEVVREELAKAGKG